MNEENVVETNEEQIQGVIEKTRNNVPAKEVSKWSMVIAAIWIGGLSLLKAFWGLIAKSPDPFGLSIKEIVFSGVALAAVFTPVYFSIFMDKIRDTKLGAEETRGYYGGYNK